MVIKRLDFFQWFILFLNVIGILFGLWCLYDGQKILGLITIAGHLLWAGLIVTQDPLVDDDWDENLLGVFPDVVIKADVSLRGMLEIYYHELVFTARNGRVFSSELDTTVRVEKEGRAKLNIGGDIFVFSGSVSRDDCFDIFHKKILHMFDDVIQ